MKSSLGSAILEEKPNVKVGQPLATSRLAWPSRLARPSRLAHPTEANLAPPALRRCTRHQATCLAAAHLAARLHPHPRSGRTWRGWTGPRRH